MNFSNLYAIRTKCIDVWVINEIDAVQIDHSQIGCRWFQFVNVDDFINFLLLFFDLFIGADKMQYLERTMSMLRNYYSSYYTKETFCQWRMMCKSYAVQAFTREHI